MRTEDLDATADVLSAAPLSSVARPALARGASDGPARTAKLAPVAAVLFASGMCGLVFQVAWSREFRLVFGASTAASSAVLAVFMGGLGLGNVVLGRRADRSSNPLALYARFEFAVALVVALSPVSIDVLHTLYVAVGGQAALGLPVATAMRLAISLLVMGVPAFLMGGTLPAAIRAVTVRDDHHRRAAALLYGVNTLGAVVGAFGSTFFALELLGTRETLWLACIVNVSIALSARAISRFASPDAGQTSESVTLAGHELRRRPAEPLGDARQSKDTEVGFDDRSGRLDPRNVRIPPSHRSRRREHPRTKFGVPVAKNASEHSSVVENQPVSLPRLVIYVVALIAGFSFFLMELVWYRMMAPILGGTTYTFGLILAVALAGIGIGGAVYAILARRIQVSAHALTLTSALEACCVAIPFAVGDRLAVLAAQFHDASQSSFLGEVAGWAVIAAVVVLPAAIVSGFQFPLLVALLGHADKDVGKHVGLAFGWNTLGAICGALAGGFGLLPLLTAPGVWRLVAALLASTGTAVAIHASRSANRRTWTIATLGSTVVAVGLIACPGPTAVWRHGAIGAARGAWHETLATPNAIHDWENSVRRSVVWEADGVESSIAIVASDALAFYVNGMCDGNAVGDAGTQVMLGLIGAALHPQPRSARVVGLGTGETAGWLAKVDSIERVDVVELEPAVQEMARRCAAVNGNALANPKVRLIYNDARETLLTTAVRYDLIACEPSNPYRAGIANLFTREFYLAGRDRLNDGGLFAQWLQAYEIDEQTMRSVFATFKSVFPHVEVWRTKDGDFVLLGSSQRPDYSAARLRRNLTSAPFATAMTEAWHTTELEGFLSHYVGGPALVDRFIGAESAAINTDDHNSIEYGCARGLGRVAWDASGTLSRQAVEATDSRPNVRDGTVDWQAVVANRQWDAAVRSSSQLSTDDLTLESAPCDTVLEKYIAHDARGTLTAWAAAQSQSSAVPHRTGRDRPPLRRSRRRPRRASHRAAFQRRPNRSRSPARHPCLPARQNRRIGRATQDRDRATLRRTLGARAHRDEDIQRRDQRGESRSKAGAAVA